MAPLIKFNHRKTDSHNTLKTHKNYSMHPQNSAVLVENSASTAEFFTSTAEFHPPQRRYRKASLSFPTPRDIACRWSIKNSARGIERNNQFVCSFTSCIRFSLHCFAQRFRGQTIGRGAAPHSRTPPQEGHRCGTKHDRQMTSYKS